MMSIEWQEFTKDNRLSRIETSVGNLAITVTRLKDGLWSLSCPPFHKNTILDAYAVEDAKKETILRINGEVLAILQDLLGI